MGSDDDKPDVQPESSNIGGAPQPLADSQPLSIEDLRQSSFQYMQDGFSILDANGVHVDVNPAFCVMTGYSQEELIGVSPEFCYWPPEELKKIQIAFEKTLRGEFSEIELIFMRKDGERFPALVVPFAIRDEASRTTFYAATVKDITERLKIEDALKNSEVRYHKLFHSAGDAIVIMDEHRILDFNQRTRELFGYSRDQILSTSIIDFFPPKQPSGKSSREFFFEMVEASRSGNPQFFEWTGRNVDGTPIHTEVTMTSFAINNKHYLQSIARDITHRKTMEEELVDLNKTLEDRVSQRTEELEKAHAELLQQNIHYRELAKRLTQAEEKERKRIARLLHDNHQQLLVAAKFRIEMLQNGSADPTVSSAAREVLEILDQAVEITRSLTMELAPPILLGSELVVAIQRLARQMEEEHQLSVVVQGSLLPTRISTDVSDVLFRSVRELLFNVVKHSGVRQARVSLALTGQRLQLIVEDKGTGFDAAGILQPTGSYGLFSIHQQLRALDGRLEIASTLQRGTICTVSIPITTADFMKSEVWSPDEGITTGSTNTPQTIQGPIRILVADDHTVARNALVQILNLAEDFDVVGEAVDGVDAIEKAGALNPDVILMDVSMPKLNGIEATRSIIADFSEIKIIALSMHSSEEMESRMLAAGATHYLQKLTPVEQIFASIRGVMDKESAGAS